MVSSSKNVSRDEEKNILLRLFFRPVIRLSRIFFADRLYHATKKNSKILILRILFARDTYIAGSTYFLRLVLRLSRVLARIDVSRNEENSEKI